MKRNVKKITLNRETLRNLDAQDLAKAGGAEEAGTYPCYPRTIGASCNWDCPVEPFSKTNCA